MDEKMTYWELGKVFYFISKIVKQYGKGPKILNTKCL